MRRFASAGVAAALVLWAAAATAAFENLEPSPRARAMGGAAVAIADDVFATTFNPAGLGGQARPGVGLSYLRPYGVDFAELLFGTAVVPAGRYGTVGVALRVFDVDWDHDAGLFGGEDEKVDLLQESKLTFAHGLQVFSDLHSTVRIGWALSAYHLEFGDMIAEDAGTLDPGGDTVLGLDGSVLVILHERTRLGVLATNLNHPQIGRDGRDLPQRLDAGLAYEPYDGVVTTFQIESALDEDTRYRGGVEFAALPGLALRLGALSNPSKLTAGFGFELAGLGVDYGFSSGGGILDPTHHFGVRYAWGGERP